MRLRDIATILVALAMTGALIWYVTGTFLLNRTVFAVAVVLLLFGGVGELITREPARRQAILHHKYWFIWVGVAVMATAATVAIATHHLHDLTRGGFGFITVVFLAGLQILYLPRACWWHGRFIAKHTRVDDRS